MGPVSSALQRHIQVLLDERRVVVWYDPYDAFGAFFEAAAFERAVKLALEDGYFNLRRTADPHTVGLRHGVQGTDSVLVYVPGEPLKEQMDLLFPLTSLGTAYRETLHQVARRALKDVFSTEQIREWTDVEGITLAKLDELAGAGSEISPLDVVFGKIGPEQVGLEYLRSEAHSGEVERRKLTGALRLLLERTYGVRFPERELDPAQLRDAFAERVLLIEFLDDLDEVPEALEHLVLPGKTQVQACRRLARDVRELTPLQDDYQRWAEGAETKFHLSDVEYDPERIGRCDTFGFEERLALTQVQRLAGAGDWDEALEWVEERGKSFWATRDETRKSQWLASRWAIELFREAKRVAESLPAGATPPDWVAWYTDEDGVWRLDRLARRLDQLALSFADNPDLADVVRLARERAGTVEQEAAEGFVDAVAAGAEKLLGLAQQTEVFADHVRTAVERGRKTVFVLADALRYEMGRELARALEPDGSVELDHAIAALPTITKVGMAALTPGAENGVALTLARRKLVPRVGDTPLKDLAARRKVFEHAFGARFRDLTLDDCLTKAADRLAEMLADADVVLLRSQEIDVLGEADNVFQARRMMSDIIPSLQQGIQRLVRAGAEEFVVAADHGYLLRGDLSDAMKIDCPAGAVEAHRRCAAGEALERGEHHVVLDAATLGLGTEPVQVAFPRGINIFKVAGGNMAYLHGGISLQELVVPVIRYTPAGLKEERGEATVDVAVPGDRITNSFFQVVVRYQAGDLFAQDETLRFRVVGVKDGEPVTTVHGASEGFRAETGEVELRNGQESVVHVGFTDPPEGEGNLEIRVIDTEIGEVIVKKVVPYELSF